MRTHELYGMIPEDQLVDILSCYYCELDRECMCCGTKQYKELLTIAPRDMTIIDLGCYVAAQCYYFTDYKRYIGVDSLPSYDYYEDCLWCHRFYTDNVTHYESSIQDFIRYILPEIIRLFMGAINAIETDEDGVWDYSGNYEGTEIRVIHLD